MRLSTPKMYLRSRHFLVLINFGIFQIFVHQRQWHPRGTDTMGSAEPINFYMSALEPINFGVRKADFTYIPVHLTGNRSQNECK